MGRKQLLGWMVGSITINYIGRSAMSIAGPDIAKQYGFSEAELGQIFAAFWLGYAVMMWPSGWLADRFGAARVLGICGLVTAAALAGNAGVSVLFGFLALRLAFGVFSAVFYPACGSLTLAFPSEQFASVQGLVGAGSNLGAAVAPMLVLGLSRWWGWQGAFLAVAGLTLVFFVLWVWRMPTAPTAAPERREFLRLSRPLVLLSLQYFCISYFYSFGDSWSFYYFREIRHFPEEQSALFATLLQVAGGVMMPLGGWLTDVMAPRWGRVRPIFLGLAASGVMLAASTWMVSPVAVLTLITAAYGLVVACEGAFWWAVLTNSADSPGAGYGLANGIGNLAQFAAPLLMPWIAARWGWDAAVWSVALALAGAAAFWVSTYSASWRPLRSSS